MKKIITSALIVAAAMAGSTGLAAAANGCASSPASKWQPKTKLEDMLKSEGMTVKHIKTENGCYEVYALDKAGKRANIAFNAETLQKVKNPEAGEN